MNTHKAFVLFVLPIPYCSNKKTSWYHMSPICQLISKPRETKKHMALFVYMSCNGRRRSGIDTTGLLSLDLWFVTIEKLKTPRPK